MLAFTALYKLSILHYITLQFFLVCDIATTINSPASQSFISRLDQIPDCRKPAVRIQTKIYETIDRRASSTKQNIPVHRRADSNDHISRSLTCTVTTRPAVDGVLDGDGRSSSNLVVKTRLAGSGREDTARRIWS